MRRLFLLLFVFALTATLWALPQEQSQPASQDQAQSASQDQSQPEQAKKEKKEKKKKDKKKKDKKKDSGPQDVMDSPVFSETIANNVLSDLRDGFEGHSQRLALSAFDDEKMDGYLSFEDQLQQLFERYEGFRIHYRIIQSTVEGQRGVILVDWQMEEMPRGGAPPQRRDGQIKFELERGRKGWKIVDFNPRGAFS